MTRSRRRRIIGLAVVVAVAVGVVAFLLTNGRTGPTTQQSGGGKATTTITVGATAVAPTLDHAPYFGVATNETKIPTVESLLRYKKVANQLKVAQRISDVEADLAQSWTVNHDGSVTLKLRSARSSFGNTLTAEDVEWSFNRDLAIDPNAGGVADVASIDKSHPVTVLGPRQVRVNVTKPNPLILAALTAWNFEIYDATEVKKHTTAADPWAKQYLSTAIAGYGPYAVQSFSPSNELRLTANRNYWQGKPDIDRVIVRAIGDTSTRTTLAGSGSIDIASGLTFDQFSNLAKQGMQTIKGRRDGQDVLGLNERFQPFKSADVRRAISVALDRQAINQSAYASVGRPALYQMPSTVNRPLPTPVAYKPDQAKQLLASAGYPNGFEMGLAVCSCRPGPWAEQVGVAIQQQLAKVGIKVNLKVVPDSPTYETGVRQDHSYDAFLYSDGVIMMDPSYYINNWLVSSGPQNYIGYQNPQLDSLVKSIATMPVGAERTKADVQAQDILEKDVPWVPLVEAPIPWVFSKRIDLSGFVMYPDHVIHYQDLKVK